MFRVFDRGLHCLACACLPSLFSHCWFSPELQLHGLLSVLNVYVPFCSRVFAHTVRKLFLHLPFSGSPLLILQLTACTDTSWTSLHILSPPRLTPAPAVVTGSTQALASFAQLWSDRLTSAHSPCLSLAVQDLVLTLRWETPLEPTYSVDVQCGHP